MITRYKNIIIFFLFNTIRSFKFYLKKPDADLYMGRPGNDVYFTEFQNADIFTIKESGVRNEDIIVVTSKDNHVLDISGGGTRLLYWSEHGGNNQRFQIINRAGGKVKIVNKTRCVSYNVGPSKFDMWDCKEDDPVQEFIMEPVVESKNSKQRKWSDSVEVSRTRLEAVKRAIMECEEITKELGAEAIAELGETDEETKSRLIRGGLRLI